MRRFLPQNWYLATWIVVVIWLFMCIRLNWPGGVSDPSLYTAQADSYLQIGGRPQFLSSVRFYRNTGFPITYIQYRLLSATQAVLDFYSVGKLILNVLLCLAAVAAVATIGQWPRKPSIVHVAAAVLIYPAILAGRRFVVPATARFLADLGPEFHYLAVALAIWYVHIVILMPLLIVPVLGYRSWVAANPQL